MTKRGSPGSPARLVLGLAVLLAALMGAAMFVVLGTPPEPAGDDSATVETDGPGDGAPVAPEKPGTGRRTVRTSGGAAAGEAATLVGRLRDYRTRAPVAGMTISLTIPAVAEGAEALVLATQSDATGAFRFTELPPRAGCALSGAQDPFAPVALSGIDLAPLETRDVGTIWLDVPVDLPVEVLELDGSPVAGADVAVFATAGGAAATGDDDDAGGDERGPVVVAGGAAGIAATPSPTASATTDEAGAALVSGLLPGTYHVRATAEGHGVAFEDGVLVAPDATRTRVRLLLPRGHTLRGSVLDAEEQPVTEGRVLAAPALSRRKSMDKRECAIAPDGTYALTGLATGNHTLYLERPDRPLVQAGIARIPEMSRLDIRLRPTAALVGTVTASDGTPLAGAQVSYLPQGGLELTTLTGEDGTYRMEDVPSGPSQWFRVTKEGFVPFPDPTAPQQGTGEALREGVEVRRDVVLEAGIAVHVSVVSDEDETPIEAATVELRMAQMWGGGGKPWKATTGENGAATFPGIVPGTYLVLIRAPGWVQPNLPANPSVLLQSVQAMPEEWRLDVSAEETRTFRLQRGGTVSGTVLGPDGSPFAGARVTVDGAQSQAPIFSAEDGTFTVDAVPARRRVTASATAPDLPQGTSEPFAIEAGERVEDIEITLAAGARITGRVRSSDGRPLAGAFVRCIPGRLHERNPWGFQQFDQAAPYPVTEDGAFEIPGLADGVYTVRADADDHLPGWDATPTITSGQDAGGVDIILDTATEMSGRVETAAGAPVPGAGVTANYTGAGNERQWGFVTAVSGSPAAQTDAEGRFTLRGLKPGNYNVWANAPGHAGANATTTTGTGEIVLRLGKAERISGVVKGPDGSPLPGVPVMAQMADRSRNRELGWWGGGNQVFTAPDGSFEFLDLAEGVYDLTVSANQSWGRDVNVKDTTKQGVRTGTTDVEIVVQAGTTIEGRVVDQEDRPVTAGWVSAQNETGGGNRGPWGGNQRWARIRPDGTFRISGLEPGAHTVQVYGTHLSDPMRGVAAGTTDVELRVRAGHTIQGRLLDGQGLSIATGFNVQIRKQGTDGWTWTQVFQPGDGAFVLTNLEATAYDVKIQASPFAPVEIPNVVAGTDDLQIVLQQGQEIAGTIVSARGDPLSAQIQAIQINLPAGATPTNGWARSAADGTFKIVGLVDGEYRLFVMRARGHAPALVEPVRGGASGLRVTLEVGTTVSGTVKYEDGTPVQNARLQLMLDGGLAIAWSRTLADGAFTFENVPSTGAFTITGNAWDSGRSVPIAHEEKIQPGATDVAVVVK